MIAQRARRLAATAATGALVAACGTTGGSTGDAAADFPQQTVQVIFPFDAGSPGDVNARALAEQAEGFLGTDIEVVNRPGAAGTIGVTEVIQAKPDGHTIGMVPIAPMTVQPHRNELAYGGPEDYEPIMGTSLIVEALSVKADSPYETLEDFIAAATSDKATVAVSGEGTILDIDAKLLAAESGANIDTVSYDGEQQLLAAMLGDTTDAAVSGVSAVKPFVESGDVRVLGVYAEETVPVLPDVPTMAELGYDITFGVNNFLIAPKGTDPAIIEALHDAFHQAWETDEYQSFLEDQGFIPQYMSTDELGGFLEEQYAQYGEVVEQLNLSS